MKDYCDITDVPVEVIAAAVLIEKWMVEHNHKHWRIGSVCSDTYAVTITELREKLDKLDKTF